jgi:hypothetical protein
MLVELLRSDAHLDSPAQQRALEHLAVQRVLGR